MKKTTEELEGDLKDLALMIGRLVTALRRARPMAPQDLDYQALNLLARKGLRPSPLRTDDGGPVLVTPNVGNNRL